METVNLENEVFIVDKSNCGVPMSECFVPVSED